MIKYHPGDWAVCFAFQLKGSVFPRAVAWAAPCSLMTFCLHYLLRLESWESTLPWMEVGASVMSNFTFVLGFLIVFRVNQAYSRWWEGGTLLQKIRGDWFNAYSSLLAFCDESKISDDVEHFKHTLARLISLLYSNAIHQVSTANPKVFECIDIDGLSPDHVDFMTQAHNRCEVVLQWIQKLVVEADKNKWIKIAPPILSRVYNQLGDGIVDLNNAQKIAEFPIPFPLAQMVTIMLLYHVFLTCTVCAYSIKTSFWASLFSFVIVFSFQSINYIAVELEDPFGDDDNDLPLLQMTRDMNTSLITLLADRAMTVPPTLLMEEKHRELLVKSIDFDKELFAMASGYLADREGRRAALTRSRSKSEQMPAFSKSDRLNSEIPVEIKVGEQAELPEVAKGEQQSQLKQQNGNIQPQASVSSRAPGQVAISQSTSVVSKETVPLLPAPAVSVEAANLCEAQSAERQHGQLQALPPEATESARESVEMAVQTAVRDLGQIGAKLSEAAGRPSSSSSSAFGQILNRFEQNAKVDNTQVKSAEKPTQSTWANPSALPEVTTVDASRQALCASSVVIDGKVETVATEGVDNDCNNMAMLLTVEPQSAGRQSGHLPVEIDNRKREFMGIAQVAAQTAGRDSGSIAVVVSAADESAGREPEQGAAPLLSTSDYDSDWL